MVALQIRDVPDETRDALVRLAGRKGQSLQAFLLDALTDVARRESNLAALDRIGRTVTAQLSSAEVLDQIDAGRAQRDDALLRRRSP